MATFFVHRFVCAGGQERRRAPMDILCVVHGGVVVYRQTSISNDEMENKNDCHYLCLVKKNYQDVCVGV